MERVRELNGVHDMATMCWTLEHVLSRDAGLRSLDTAIIRSGNKVPPTDGVSTVQLYCVSMPRIHYIHTCQLNWITMITDNGCPH